LLLLIFLRSIIHATPRTPGSLFQLLGPGPAGTTEGGSSGASFDAVPAVIALLGFPTALFLFLAAIQKAIAETDEDDEKFLSGR
jgi:hypothetical protein